MKKRRGFIFTPVFVFLFCLAGACEREKMPEVPNFIFIAVDDLNVYNTVLGSLPQNFLQKVYPDPELRADVLRRLTPSISELADEALTFTNAFCPAPLCGPSRTALMTGIPPHVSGYYHHDRHFRAYESLTDVKTLPQTLRLNGYYTTGVGKLFHKGRSYLDRGYFSDWPDQLYSWTQWLEVYTGTGKGHDSEIMAAETPSRYWPGTRHERPAFTRFGVTSLPIEESNDYRNAMHIADMITKGESIRTNLRGEEICYALPGDQNYFLGCGLFAPHLPWVVPQEFIDLFPLEEMAIDRELLEWVRADLEDLSPSGQKATSRTNFTRLLEHGLEIDGEGGDINAWKAAFQAYLATIAFSDRNVGVLLEAIHQNPGRDNTVVFLWSDHGYHNGDKNREGKTTLWEGANHCNLIILDPRREGASSGLRCDATVSLQDIYPTIMELAGLERPAHVYGHSLVPLMDDPLAADWNYPSLSTNGEGNHSLRTSEYRYLRYRNGDEELYHINEDPLEEHNLFSDPSFADELLRLRKLMDLTLAEGPYLQSKD